MAQALARKGTVLKHMGRRADARSTWLALLDSFQMGEHPDIDSHIVSVKRALVHMDRPGIVRALDWPLRLLGR